MAGKRLKLDDFNKEVNLLSLKEVKKINGGYAAYSPGAGSVGSIQWDEIDFRNLGEGPINNSNGFVRPSRPGRAISKG